MKTNGSVVVAEAAMAVLVVWRAKYWQMHLLNTWRLNSLQFLLLAATSFEHFYMEYATIPTLLDSFTLGHWFYSQESENGRIARCQCDPVPVGDLIFIDTYITLYRPLMFHRSICYAAGILSSTFRSHHLCRRVGFPPSFSFFHKCALISPSGFWRAHDIPSHPGT